MYLFSEYDHLASMHVFHAFVGPPRTGVADDFESPHTCWELSPGLARATRAGLLLPSHHFSPHLTFETRSFTGLGILHLPLADGPESPWVLSMSTLSVELLRRLAFLCLLTAASPQFPTFRPNGTLLCGPATLCPSVLDTFPACASQGGIRTALTVSVGEVECRCDYARLPFLLLELQCQAGCGGACLQPQHSEGRPGELSL